MADMTMTTPFIPAAPEHYLPFVLGRLAPTDRRALCAIVESVQMVPVEGGPDLLVMPATPELIDALAAFMAEAEDRENDLEDEEPEDDEETADDEPSLGSLNNSRIDQRDWSAGGTMDLEPAGDDEARVQLAHVTADPRRGDVIEGFHRPEGRPDLPKWEPEPWMPAWPYPVPAK